MKHVILLTATAALSLAFTNPSFSTTPRDPSLPVGAVPVPAEDWRGGEVLNATNPAESYCAVESRFNNGMRLGLVESHNGGLTFVLRMNGDVQTTEKKMNAVVALHQSRQWHQFHTSAVLVSSDHNGTTLAIPYGKLPDDGPLLQTADIVSLRINGNRQYFALDGIHEALARLSTCVANLGSR